MSNASYYNSAATSPVKVPAAEAYPLGDKYEYDHVPSQFTDEHLESLRHYDAKLKRRIRVLRIISRVCTAIFSLAVTVMMAMSLHKFSSTKNTFINGRNAWARNTKIWPTVMLFCVAAVTLILNLAIVIAYLRSFKAANRASTITSIFGAFVLGIHVLVWIAAVTLYRWGKDTNGISNDLWGWSCSQGAEKIQNQFRDVVNFSRLCNSSASAWYTSIIEACLEILSVIIYFMAFRRLTHKKKIDVVRRSIAPQNL
ncbi:hypothetical protein GP486_001083 [Trichoglossum hirsutum]|uniref:MARVEL domain-containing protein n=1 Tax=Trichoglossum hirsutum TaxID=265104 RepID=A0A9P8LHI9_9PEZI|nr:hypothetical protein GP486_001083 [Trichoglossum hirsutum]